MLQIISHVQFDRRLICTSDQSIMMTIIQFVSWEQCNGVISSGNIIVLGMKLGYLKSFFMVDLSKGTSGSDALQWSTLILRNNFLLIHIILCTLQFVESLIGACFQSFETQSFLGYLYIKTTSAQNL